MVRYHLTVIDGVSRLARKVNGLLASIDSSVALPVKSTTPL